MTPQQAAETFPKHLDTDFDELLPQMQSHADTAFLLLGPHIFCVETDDLYTQYLANMPTDQARHFHTCHTCKTMIERFGHLALVSKDKELVPLLWPDPDLVPKIYKAPMIAMRHAIRRGRISGVFLSTDRIWGTPEAGGFSHFHINAEAMRVKKHILHSTGQRMAQKREDFRTLSRAITEFNEDTLAQALTLLKANALYQSEKVKGPVEFLFDLKQSLKHSPHKHTLLWQAVAHAPAGWCTPRASMAGSLIEDIESGLPVDAVKRKFDAKMGGLDYQRPKAAPARGNIENAEKIVEKLGIARSLERRFARFDEIELIWSPPEREQSSSSKGGVFSDLMPKGGVKPMLEPLIAPQQRITWVRFARDVLPEAREIEVYMERSKMNLAAMLTAVHPDAPPILKWDREERRNPVSWYIYHGGSDPARWGARAGSWVRSPGITLIPPLWEGMPRTDYTSGSIILLEGLRDQHEPSLALFPVFLRSELHEVRSTLEAYSKSKHPSGIEESSACGLRIGDEGHANKIRVTSKIGQAIYHIDRWE